MNNHVYSEMRSLNQLLLGLFIAANYACLLSLTAAAFPWLAYLGTAVGLSVILLCWLGKRSVLFITGLFAATFPYLLLFEWHTIFQ
ncbi:hypothetical protein ELQ35_09760 [Peribacillus cavernae]|uniref:Uncharacterized protein n=1 Tax=Peribacillus cavernae TaxID=1674310 RepID=A0A3S0U3X7_9BACI|nr:hypothetical protein [Peribacillus cavernae]MDQ0221299.1 hypothetical protein [Peribacillus cavernae]RUQ29638.1 hypothetical protein ELQ35_09760 [Peribacillus cavernae]